LHFLIINISKIYSQSLKAEKTDNAISFDRYSSM